jgi:hypothetical protein
MIKHLLFGTALFFISFAHGQETVKSIDQIKTPDVKGLYAGLGAELTSVNIFRNYRQNPYQLGVNFRAYYHYKRWSRVMAEYTYVPKFDLDPTWNGVTNVVAAVNVSILAHIQDEAAMFYTITGLCFQRWKGHYTGLHDYNPGTKDKFEADRDYITKTPGLNLGVGFERAFTYDQIFGEFRYRFSQTESGFGITDAAFSAGIKFRVTDFSEKKKLKGKYNWF